MKRKLSLKLISLLSVLVLVGVGFAAWVIVKPADDATTNGSFTTYGYEEASYGISVAVKDSGNSSIVFGKPKSYSAKNTDWLVPSTDMSEENLSVTFVVTLKLNDEKYANYLPSDVYFAIGLSDGSESKWNTAKEYVDGPSVKHGKTALVIKAASSEGSSFGSCALKVTGEGAVFTKNASYETQYSCEITVEFGWGTSKLNGQNPYNYFNASGKDYKSNNNDAKAALDAINNLNSVSYSITVSPNDQA